jgi:HSP20 family protein
MAIVRWQPARELHSIQRDFNRLFGATLDIGSSGYIGASRRYRPAMDLVEEGQEFVLRADLPGLGEDDVKVEVDDDMLTVSGQRRSEHGDRKEGCYRVERAYGSFSRSLTLPDGIDPESIEARFENGVLEVRIPKPSGHERRRVAIKVGNGGHTVSNSPSDTPAEEGQPAEENQVAQEGQPKVAKAA